MRSKGIRPELVYTLCYWTAPFPQLFERRMQMGHLLTLCAASDGGLAAGVLGVILLVGVVFFGLWIWSLIHCITNKQLSDNNRIIGIILIVVLGLLGSLVYLFLPRERVAARRGLDRGRAGARPRGRYRRETTGSRREG
jgi:ABC-type transport system involved in cytochrome c biogenesis permease subunit